MKKLIAFIIISLFVSEKNFAQDFTFNLQYDGKQRTFFFHSPCATYDCTGKKIPLIFAFHGLTETNTAIRTYSEFNQIADTAGFAVIYAQGLNNTWNVGFGGSTVGEDDLGFTGTMIDFVLAGSHCTGNDCPEIDENRIYSCGMSNGGFFSYLLACQLSDRIAAIASVTGSMTTLTYDNCNPQRAVPVFQLHGTADPIVPYGGSAMSSSKSIDDVLNYWVNHNGCNSTPSVSTFPDINTNDNSTVESIRYDNCNNSTEVLHYKILNGGHTWSGMPNPYPAFITGSTNYDIHASNEMWLFFKNHSLTGAATTHLPAINEKQVKYYPNPVSDILIIESDKNATLHISDITGKKLIEEFLTPGVNRINTAHYKQGVYLLHLQYHSTSQYFKIVKG